MNSTEFLKWLPSEIRQKHMDRLEGCTAVKFPVAYFARVPQSMNLNWVLLSPVDSDGMVVRTGPDFLVKGLIKTMQKYNQEFETVKI